MHVLGQPIENLPSNALMALLLEIDLATFKSCLSEDGGNLRLWLHHHFLHRDSRKFKAIGPRATTGKGSLLETKLADVSCPYIIHMLRELARGMDYAANFPAKSLRVALNELVCDDLRPRKSRVLRSV